MTTPNINSLLATVPKLNRKNYHTWKFAISMVLRQAGCWEIVQGKTKRPASREAGEAWDLKAGQAFTTIGLTVDSDQYQYISESKDGVEAWTALAKIYEKNSRANRVALKRQFFGYHHDPSKPIQDYIDGIIDLASRLKAIGVKLEDNDIMDVLLFNLDETWSNIAASLCTTVDDLGTILDITGALLDEEGRRGGPDPNVHVTDDTAMHGAERNVCRNCHKVGHGMDACWAPGGKGKKRCFICEKEGHIAFQCPQIKEIKEKANHAVEEEFAY